MLLNLQKNVCAEISGNINIPPGGPPRGGNFGYRWGENRLKEGNNS